MYKTNEGTIALYNRSINIALDNLTYEREQSIREGMSGLLQDLKDLKTDNGDRLIEGDPYITSGYEGFSDSLNITASLYFTRIKSVEDLILGYGNGTLDPVLVIGSDAYNCDYYIEDRFNNSLEGRVNLPIEDPDSARDLIMDLLEDLAPRPDYYIDPEDADADAQGLELLAELAHYEEIISAVRADILKLVNTADGILFEWLPLIVCDIYGLDNAIYNISDARDGIESRAIEEFLDEDAHYTADDLMYSDNNFIIFNAPRAYTYNVYRERDGKLIAIDCFTIMDNESLSNEERRAEAIEWACNNYREGV